MSSRIFKCNVCGRSFPSNNARIKHKKKYHKKYKCNKCNKTFDTNYEKNRHIMFEHKEKTRSKCKTCGVKIQN